MVIFAQKCLLWQPYLAGEEVFDSKKRKADVPLGFEGESHQLDKVNYSCPQIMTKSSRANHISCSLPDMVEFFLKLQEDQASNNLGIAVEVKRPSYVTAIQETTVKR